MREMSSSVVDARWTREEALEVCAAIEVPLKKVGWAIALSGSLLTKGKSTKDFDLIVYPYTTANADKMAVKTLLLSMGFTCVHEEAVVKETWKRLGSSDTKHVEVWATDQNKRVDLFFLT